MKDRGVRSKGKVIGNVMTDNIVFGSGVIAHHPEELLGIKPGRALIKPGRALITSARVLITPAQVLITPALVLITL